MYRTIELILVGQVGNLRRVGNPPRPQSTNLAICITVLLTFWAGMAWFALTTYLATGQAAVLGYYAYALVVPEAVCLIAGISALTPRILKRFIAPGLVVCFAALEVYGTVLCLMPYYAGITAHTARGGVPAMQASRLLNGGIPELFRNLAVNKPDFLPASVLLALWAGFLAAVAGIVAVSVLTASRGERGEARPSTADGLVPLGPS
jgi:hypothetical protein